MGETPDEEAGYVTMTVSVTRAQKAGVHRLAKRRDVSASVIIRDVLRPILAADVAPADEPVAATA